jgi:hypothetical protein
MPLYRDQVPFVMSSSCLPHPDDYVDGRSGEQASGTLSVKILHRETRGKVFGEHLSATAQYY